MCHVDIRIQNADQIMTTDIEKWSSTVTNLYSNVSKPILDILLFTYNLKSQLGLTGPCLIGIWYLLSIILLKAVSPAFGKMVATEQKMEGIFRSQ